jgi:single-strand DNA-binding protein
VIRSAIYGRLGVDPVERRTRNGNAMVTASLAVGVNRPGDSDETEWFSVIAFGKAAEDLARHAKGDLIAAIGQLTRSRFTCRDGAERIGWSLAVEAIVSARIVRPGRRRHNAAGSAKPRPNDSSSSAPMPNDGVGDLWQT